MNVYAIILAAGFSTRMAPEFKPLLSLPYPHGETGVLPHIATLYARHGVHPLVVGGHNATATAAAAHACGADVVCNPAPEQGMFSSICAGVAALPPDCTHFFVHPVDIPLVRPMTVCSLLTAVRDADTVLIPGYKGESGHPPLFAAACREGILAWHGEGGLRGFMARTPCRVLPVADAHILRDMDTPADAALLRELAPHYDLLSPPEGEELLAVHGLPPQGQNHCRAVAAVAAAFAVALNRPRAAHDTAPLLDVPLARVGGMVHDVCKGEKHHETAAGKLFRRWDMPRMAWLVESHRDLSLPDDAPITEREVVFLADKYVRGPRPVTLEARYGQKLEIFAGDPAAQDAIRGRLTRAQALAHRMERECGHDLAALAARTLPCPDTGEPVCRRNTLPEEKYD